MSQRVSTDPVDEAHKVHGGGRGDMLQVRLGVSEVTRSPQIKGPYALRYGGLDSSPHAVKAGELGRLLTSPHRFAVGPAQSDRCVQAWQSFAENLTLMTGVPRLSFAGLQ